MQIRGALRPGVGATGRLRGGPAPRLSKAPPRGPPQQRCPHSSCHNCCGECVCFPPFNLIFISALRGAGDSWSPGAPRTVIKFPLSWGLGSCLHANRADWYANAGPGPLPRAPGQAWGPPVPGVRTLNPQNAHRCGAPARSSVLLVLLGGAGRELQTSRGRPRKSRRPPTAPVSPMHPKFHTRGGAHGGPSPGGVLIGGQCGEARMERLHLRHGR